MSDITMTVQELFNAKMALRRIGTLKFKGRVGYWFARLDAKLESEFKVAEEKRMELVKKHGKQDKRGQFEVAEEGMKAFGEEYKELSEQEITLDAFKMKASVFADAEVFAGDIMALEAAGLLEDDGGDDAKPAE